MSDTDRFREGERLGLAWIDGQSELVDDLAVLVAGMKEFGAMERGFLLTIGNAARQAAVREPRPAPAGAPAPARLEAQTPVAPPAQAPIDVDESWRRARERVQRARLEELWRANSQLGAALLSNRPHGMNWSSSSGW